MKAIAAAMILLMNVWLVWYLSRSIHRTAYRGKSINSKGEHFFMLIMLFIFWMFMIAAALAFFVEVFEPGFKNDIEIILAAAGLSSIINYSIVWKLGRKKYLKANQPSEPSKPEQNKAEV